MGNGDIMTALARCGAVARIACAEGSPYHLPAYSRRNASARHRCTSRGTAEALERRALLAAVSWDGGGNGTSWNDANNWSGNAVPTAADDVTVNVATNPAIQVTDNRAVRSLVSDEALTITALGTLDVATAATFNAGFTLAGTLTGAGGVTLSGAAAWNGGAMSGAGTTTVAPGATLSLDTAGTKLLARRLVNSGTTNWTAGQWNFSRGTVDNNATFNANSAAALAAYGITASGANAFNNNAGATFNKQGAGAASFNFFNTALPFNNAAGANVNCDGGSLTLAGGGATVDANASGTGAGPVAVDAGASVTYSRNYLHDGAAFSGPGTVNFAGGTQSVTGAVTCALETTLTLGLGSMSIAGSLAANGTTRWTGGTIGGTAPLTIGAAGSLFIETAALKALTGRIVNNGTAAWTGGQWNFGGGTFDNNRTFTANSPADLPAYGVVTTGPANAFNNNAGATFNKEGAGAASFNFFNTAVPFNNAGTVNVAAGSLQLTRDGSHTGSFSLPNPAARLELGGTHLFAPSAGVTGPGTVAVTAGPASTFNGPRNFAGSFEVSGGVANLNDTTSIANLRVLGGTLGGGGAVVVSGTLTWNAGAMADAGTTTVAPGATLNLATGGVKALGRRLVNNGTATWTAGQWNFGSPAPAGGGTFDNYGTFTANSAAALPAYGIVTGGAVNAFNNNAGATFNKQGAGAASFNFFNTALPFNNAVGATVRAGGGSLVVAGGSSNPAPDASGTGSGAVAVDVGAAVTYTTNYTHAGAAFAGPGNVNFAGGTQRVTGTTTFAPDSVLTISGGALTVFDNLTANGTTHWTGGTINGSGTFTVPAAGTLQLEGGTRALGGRLVNNGTANWTAGQWNFGGGTFDNNGTFTVTATANLPAYGIASGAPSAFNNTGRFVKQGAATVDFNNFSAVLPFNNPGTVDVQNGTLAFNSALAQYVPATNTLSGGTWVVRANGRLVLPSSPASSIRTLSGDVTLEGATSSFDAINALSTVAAAGRFALAGGRDFTASAGGAFNNNGVVSLGPDSVLNVAGAYAQSGTGRLQTRIIGAGPANFGQLSLTGAASLAGALDVAVDSTFTPPSTDSYQVMVFGSRPGGSAFAAYTGLDLPNGVLVPVYGAADLVLDVNLDPVAVNDSAQTLEDEPVTLDADVNDTDPDHTDANADLDPPTINAITQPAHGTAVLNGNGTITYMPALNYNGPDAVTYTLRDSAGNTATGTVTVNVAPVNDPPVATPDAVAAATEDIPLNLSAAQLLANDTPGPANEAGQAMAVTAVSATPNTHGTVSVAGGVITFTPEPNYSGPASFTYTVTDAGTTNGVPDARTASSTVNLTVTPTGPKVSDVFVAGSTWSPSFLTSLSNRGLGHATYGYRIVPAGSNAEVVPWTGVDTVAFRFDSDVSIPAGAAVVRSAVTGATYAPAPNGVTYDVLTRTLRIRLVRPIAVDRLELRLAGDAGGIFRTGPGVDNARLDGEFAGALPSGNGTPGGDFAFRFNVLPGDTDRDGRVTTPDLVALRQKLLRTTADSGTGSASYSPFHDVNASGRIDGADYLLLRSRLFNRLPAASPITLARSFSTRRGDMASAVLIETIDPAA
jgi:hypothetical protein